jgi:hypothetical protein
VVQAPKAQKVAKVVKKVSSMKLIKEVDFKPIDKFVVCLPDKPRTYLGPQTLVDKEASTDGNTVTKVVKRAVKYVHQVMVVIATPSTEDDSKSPISAGDSILCDFRACMPLDGYDNVYVIPKYNIIGLIN